MRRGALAVVAASLLVLSLAPGAGASHDPSGEPFGEDFAVGSFLFESSLGSFGFDFSASSGPAGEAPTGMFAFESEIVREPSLGLRIEGTVTCLRVEGRRASFGLALTEPDDQTAALVGVSDEPGQTPGAEGPDTLYVKFLESPLGPGDCPVPVDPRSVEISDLFIITDETGGITVHDAPARPTSKDQCKNGGWRSFPGFKNQGECVAFVQRSPKP
jgi:hypothetical protein